MRNKYNVVLPVTLNIAITASSQGTARFTIYLEAFRQLKDMVKKGCELKIETSDLSSCQGKGEPTVNAE